MNLLAIETATSLCSVALQVDDSIRHESQHTDAGHARIVLPMIDSLLAQAGIGLTHLDAIAAGQGPGSFTGIRIGLGVVQGLCLGAELPAVGVSSLATLAQACDQPFVVAAIDARMGQIYAASYQRGDGLAKPLSEPAVLDPSELRLAKGRWYGVGSAFAVYAERMRDAVGKAINTDADIVAFDAEALPEATSMLPLAVHAIRQGQGVDATALMPLYVRNKVTFNVAG